MHRISLALVLASLVGCAADTGDESFIIRSNLAVPEGDCILAPALEAVSQSRGQIFLDSPTPYLLHPMLESRIVAAEGKESLRTVFLKGANVDLIIGPIETIDAAGNVTLDPVEETVKFQSLFSAALPPNGGLVAAEFDLVPLSALASIRQRVGANPGRVHAQVRATATVFGDFYGDQIEGAPFQFPVTVCNDCIVSRVLVNNVPAQCPLPMTAAPRAGNACNPFQDGLVDCCETNGQLVCPAPVATE